MKPILLVAVMLVAMGCETSAPQSQPKAPPPSPKATPPTEAEKKAFAETKASAERGVAASQVNLGLKYEKGQGVEQDSAQALAWFTKAAEQNVPFAKIAQFYLGMKYYKGQGVEQDYAQALAWFTRAAEQNEPRAQFYLGAMYELGEGTDEDKVRSLAWLLLAARQGEKNAIKIISFAKVSMTREQIDQAKALSEKLLKK